MDFGFIVNSIVLGFGLAMDAFSVSLANGLHYPNMKTARAALTAGVYAFFQFAMPLIGWICVHTIAEHFETFNSLIPWIALVLLGYIGIRMIVEGLKERRGELQGNTGAKALTFGLLMVQGIATSIDALSTGFTISDYGLVKALICCAIIAVITFGMCVAALKAGNRLGSALEWKASILGGVILIIIGLNVFITGVIL